MTDLTVISAGLSQPSSTRLLADRLAAATESALQQAGAQTRLTHVVLREHAHDLTNNLLTGFPSPELEQLLDAVAGADGLIATTPVFTASVSGLFKTFLDVLPRQALVGKPVLLGATGGSERHSLAIDHAMRPLFAYLGALTVPTGVFAASGDWGNEEHAAALAERIDRAGEQFAQLLRGRPAERRPDPFEDPTPFEQLLRRN